MHANKLETPVTERMWESAEAELSRAITPPLRVLFATDGSEPARAAESFLSLLPLPAGSALHVLTVLDATEWQVPESLKGAEQEWSLDIERAAEGRLTRPGVDVTHATLRGEPAAVILDVGRLFHADLIVVGSTGRTGMKRFLLGSVAEQVAQYASCPVLVARLPLHQLEQVVLAVDGSEHAARALQVTSRLPLPAPSTVHLCHSVRPYYPMVGPEYVPDLDEMILDIQKMQRRDAEKLLAEPATTLKRWGKRVVTDILDGEPATEILNLAARSGADLIVVGARGVSPVSALLFGSVADRLLRHAHSSVLIAR